MLRANYALSPRRANSPTTQILDHEREAETSCRPQESGPAFGETSACDRANKVGRSTVRDHNHANPEFVWGDEGPVNERRQSPSAPASGEHHERKSQRPLLQSETSKSTRKTTATRSCIAALVVTVVLGLVAQPAGAELCKPVLSVNDVQFSPINPPAMVRKWTAVVAVDASQCKANLRGSFEIVFTRLSETAPDMEFRERFAWVPPSVRVSSDFGRDEAVKDYRVDNVSPCICRD